ncbi:MAG: Rieske (2Fe-2S) protein [Fimbriimonadaceae bacterium]|nr:Rieske (2Fe-2S) protein [Fimbriimonadaceae bacterium]
MTDPELTRRRLLVAAGLAPLALAACGKGPDESTATVPAPESLKAADGAVAPAPAPAAGASGTLLGLGELPAGAGKVVTHEGRKIIVVRQGEDVTAFDAKCPHKGCAVVWKAKDAQFLCPCHKSIFDAGGQPVSGPAKRGLAPIRVQVDNGSVVLAG